MFSYLAREHRKHTEANKGWREAAVLLAAIGFWMVDQLSKQVVRIYLPLGSAFHIGGVLYLRQAQNTGVAFGLWAGRGLMLSLVAVLCVLAFWLWGGRRATGSRVGFWGLALLCGGALGNIYDRLRLGYVVDFIDVGFWPVFNLADVFIVVGAIFLLIASWRQHCPTEEGNGKAGAKEDMPCGPS